MMCQGSGGGYGDVLERNPELVMKDLREDLISDESAENIYKVVYDRATRRVDLAATAARRDAERKARKARGRRFDDFVAEWVKPEPPIDIPYFGSWGDDSVLYAGVGASRMKMRSDNVQAVWLADPREVRIAELEAELEAVKAEKKA